MPHYPALPCTKVHINVNAVNAVRLGGSDPAGPCTTLQNTFITPYLS